MEKTQKELAFLRDLYVAPDWTERFTNIFDENFKFTKEKTILYVNAGTGNHAIELRKKLKDDKQLSAYSQNADLNRISQAKAEIIQAKINFSDKLPGETFDAVLADASFVEPKDVPDFVKKIIGLSKNQVAFFLPTAGSFGDFFSFLWETLLHLDLLDKSAAIERLISELPTVTKLEETAANLGLTNLEVVTKTEIFEFKNGDEFINSPLIADFLLPFWLAFLTKTEKKQVCRRLVQTIDETNGELTFLVSVKATLVVGEKAKTV
jgi:hypothetical protein